MRMTTKTETLMDVDGNVHEIKPANGRGYSLREAQAMVGGLVEVVHLRRGWILLVNEEGLLRGLPYNLTASAVAGQPLVGPVALIRDRSFR